MAIITGYLRNRGYNVSQDDLNIRMRLANFRKDKSRLVKDELFLNIEKIFDYLQSGDSDIGKSIDRMFVDVDITSGYKVFLLSAFSYCQGYSPVLFNLAIAKYLKNKYPDSLVVSGGGKLIRFVNEKLFSFLVKNKCLDYVIFGPGEESLDILFQELFGKKMFSDVPGLVHIFNGKVCFNQIAREIRHEHIDYDTLPMDLYTFKCRKSYSLGKIREDKDILIIPYRFSNGCPYKCAYCFATHADKLSIKSPQEIIKDLFELKNTYGAKFFYFLDDALNFSSKFMVSLCNEIIKSGLKIYFTASILAVNLDENMFQLLYEAGCRGLVFGLETASSRLLKYTKKNLNIKDLSQALMWANRMGIWTTVNFIPGLPTETDHDINCSLDFLKDNASYIDEIQISTFRLLLNTPFVDNPREYGLKNIRILRKDFNLNQYNPNRKNNLLLDNRIQEMAFDEEGGLCWEDKKKQMEYSTMRIRRGNNRIALPLYERNHLLFYYYFYIKDKRKIKALADKATFLS